MRILLFVLAWHAAAEAAPPVAAHHAGGIQAIAVTEDGGVAVSAAGSVRLWPSLDGKREPVVVKMSAPVALAIGRDGNQLVIGGIDAIGSLEVVRLTAAGEPVSRDQVELDGRCIAIYATSAGLLAWRDDQTLALLDLHGALIGTLAPDPGQRLDNVLVRKDRALALVTVDGHVHGRWLELGVKLAWGADTPELPIDPQRAALSPDHRHVVAPASRKIGVVDLATGRTKIVERIADDNLSTPLGFIDDDTFVFDRRQAARYWVRAGKLVSAPIGSSNVRVVDHQLVGGNALDLVVQSPDGVRYLGYRIAKPRHTLAVNGGVVISGANTIVVTDEHLQTRKRYAVDTEVRDLLPLDAKHAVTLAGYGSTGYAYLVDLTKPADVPDLVSSHALDTQYEPSTRLLAVRHDKDVELRRYDPKRGELGPGTEVTVDPSEYLLLLDPAWAKGMIAVIVQRVGEGATLSWIRDEREGRIANRDDKPRPLPDDWEWTGRDLGAIGITRDIVRTRGTLRAELRAHRLSLRDGKTLRWMIPAWGVDDVAWSGERLLVLGDGIATVDLATGTFEHAQCGWDFGVWDAPTAGEGGPVLCEN